MTATDTFATVQEAAEVAYDWFRYAGRTNEREEKDDAPQWVRDLVYSAHGEFLPDDWRYQTIANAVEWIRDHDNPEEEITEFAEDQVDVYTGERLAWLSSNLRRASYCDDAVEELGYPGNIIDAIGLGQFGEASEVYGSVLRSLEESVS